MTQPVKSPVSNSPLTIVSPGEQVGVGDGVPPPPIVPLIRQTWSGPPAVGTQTGFLTQLVPHPNAPPGFRNAAPLLACTVRSVQRHSPSVPKVMLAWISIQ